MNHFLSHFNYYAAVLMILFGLYIMIVRYNLVQKVIGMGILQTGVILFYISVAVKHGAAIPIISHAYDHAPVDPAHFANPLPHALMLTAIVVGVSTLGLALALISSIYRRHQTLEEDEIMERLRNP